VPAVVGIPVGLGSSTRHAEAVELLARVHGTGELPMSFVTLMLCTCRRWDRVTSRLIAAVEDSGLLDSTGLVLDEPGRRGLIDRGLSAYGRACAGQRLTACPRFLELPPLVWRSVLRVP
jgi:hypothetical protein